MATLLEEYEGSFPFAVAAYNAQYGTSYTAEEAAEALGNN